LTTLKKYRKTTFVRKIGLSLITNTAREVFGIRARVGTKLFNNIFATLVGTKPIVVVHIYNELVRNGCLPEAYKPKYLLWALHFLKEYGTELGTSSLLGVSHNTYVKWTWLTIKLMGTIKVVSTIRLFTKSFFCKFQLSKT
jgi:hypothetical protein